MQELSQILYIDELLFVTYTLQIFYFQEKNALGLNPTTFDSVTLSLHIILFNDIKTSCLILNGYLVDMHTAEKHFIRILSCKFFFPSHHTFL